MKTTVVRFQRSLETQTTKTDEKELKLLKLRKLRTETQEGSKGQIECCVFTSSLMKLDSKCLHFPSNVSILLRMSPFSYRSLLAFQPFKALHPPLQKRPTSFEVSQSNFATQLQPFQHSFHPSRLNPIRCEKGKSISGCQQFQRQ
jgi:hypothetical protein